MMLRGAVLLLAAGGLALPAGDAPAREPTGAEMELLCWANRLRADPAGHAAELLRGLRLTDRGMPHDVDLALCRRELAAARPAPPVLMDLDLLAAARGHAAYLIANRTTGHFQKPGDPAFSGADPGVRMRAAGYSGQTVSENSFTNAADPRNAHRGFVIDWGEGPGGMLPGRGHRQSLLDPLPDEVGMAAVAHGQGGFVAAVQDFGRGRSRARRVGGVVYRDRDRDGRYDDGEGSAGAEASWGTATVTTWACGGFGLDLPDGAAGTLTLRQGGDALAIAVAAGAGTIWGEYALPQVGDAQTVETLLTAATRPGAGEAVRADCWYVSRGCAPTPEQEARILTASAGARERLQADQEAVRQAVYGLAEALTTASAAERRWRGGRAAGWFADARAVAPVYADAVTFLDQVHARRPVPAEAKGSLEARCSEVARRAASAEWRDAATWMRQVLTGLGRRP